MILVATGLGTALGFLFVGVLLVSYAVRWDHKHVRPRAHAGGGGDREMIIDLETHTPDPMTFDESLEHLYEAHFDVWSGLEPGVTSEILTAKHLREHVRLAQGAR